MISSVYFFKNIIPLKNIKSFVFFLFLLNYFTVDAQNGWVKKKSEFYAQASFSTFSSNDYYSTSGQLFDSGSTYNSNSINLYGEYGISDRFTAILNFPALLINRFNTTETVAGVGSVQLGLKYGLLKSFPLAISVDFDIPTDDGFNFAQTKSPNSLGMFEQINLPTSDGEFNIWTRLAASQSFMDGKLFGSVHSGINFRTQNFSKQWQSGIEVGYLFFEKLYLIGKLNTQGKIESNETVASSFLFGEGTTFTSLGITGIYNINEHWKIVASYSDFSDFIIARRNVYDGAAISIGIAVEY